MKTFVLAALILILPTLAVAQPATCEDTLRTVRILSEQYAASRTRTEIEAAQTIANLLKQLEALKVENEALKKKGAQ